MFKNITKNLAILTVSALTLIGSSVSVLAADTVAPTAPTSLNISNRSGMQIELSWGASTDNVGVNHYVLYADVDNGYYNWTEQIGNWVNVNDIRKMSVSMAFNQEYKFYVKAYDDAGNVSAASNIFLFNTDIVAPTAPNNFRSPNKTSSSVKLAWDPSTDSFSGINRYQIGVYKDESLVTCIDTPYLSKYIYGLQSNTTYKFEIRAIDNGYDGNASETRTLYVTTY
ncbi:fibronectin type III domain-containing protein [Acetivibrio cellulolyticus]|uniref:fibronectin type III domain-containing protein n=1 Tax=Acetivibrio cellulolyticus TaxID=35830 RepID=UPI0001E2D889|nr:fibronectin type III domain-containing protein [Acetivibrio cellulolyticus]